MLTHLIFSYCFFSPHNTLISHNMLKSGWPIRSVVCHMNRLLRFFKISQLGLSQLSWVRKGTEGLLHAKQVLSYWTIAFQQLWLVSLVPQVRKTVAAAGATFTTPKAAFFPLALASLGIKSEVACIVTQLYKTMQTLCNLHRWQKHAKCIICDVMQLTSRLLPDVYANKPEDLFCSIDLSHPVKQGGCAAYPIGQGDLTDRI